MFSFSCDIVTKPDKRVVIEETSQPDSEKAILELNILPVETCGRSVAYSSRFPQVAEAAGIALERVRAAARRLQRKK